MSMRIVKMVYRVRVGFVRSTCNVGFGKVSLAQCSGSE